MFKINWSSWNKPITKESEIDMLNRYKKGKHINMTFYNKALSYINKGFQPAFTVKNAWDSYKIMKVVKVNKGSKI
jgi:hypothetical protein